jgi:hypothetical protein
MDISSPKASLETLPLDIFTEHLLAHLSHSSLLNLSSASKSLHTTLTQNTIWTAFLRHKKYVDITQKKALSVLPLRVRVALSSRAEQGWQNHTFKTTCLFRQRWQRTCLPRLEISTEFIVVGVGADLQIHWIRDVGMFEKQTRQQQQQVQWSVYHLGQHGSEDVTEIIAMPGAPTEFIVGQAHGLIRHLQVSKQDSSFVVKRVFQHPRAIIRSLAATERYLVALASTASNAHRITFYPLSDQDGDDKEVCPLHTDLSPIEESLLPNENVVQPDFMTSHPTRPWQALFLSPTVLALGSTSPEALSIYNFDPHCEHPLTKSRQLYSNPAQLQGLRDIPPPSKTSIYAIHQHAPSLLLTGWYHGPANLHDLRLSTAYPVLSLNDPMDEGAAYSVTTDGAHRVLVGGDRHGLVKVFDLRSPHHGFSIYLGRERSPVFSVKAEHSRIFAATEGTVWECDMAFKHKPRTYENDNWRSTMGGGRGRWYGRARWGGASGGRREEESGNGQVRLHYGKQTLFREDGSEIGKSSSAGVALHW